MQARAVFYRARERREEGARGGEETLSLSFVCSSVRKRELEGERESKTKLL